ncbi:unnamed protein product [Rhizoctonia solani]|uniref:Uncharacterized protein n=1 Tax=Rhizoctonia solani TaxID=456999 RepID=A0A8H2ZYA9_9AGAM|nr:unnamed protein product [Rhizoctonia solani]
MGWSWFKKTLATAAKYAAVGTLVVTGGVMIATPLIGFTASGVAAGSLAAAIQSAVYGAAVPAGSLFAIMQSIGATGVFLPAITAGLGAGTFCGVTRIIIDAAAHAYQAASGRIREILLEIFKVLMAKGTLTALDLRRITGQGRRRRRRGVMG